MSQPNTGSGLLLYQGALRQGKVQLNYIINTKVYDFGQLTETRAMPNEGAFPKHNTNRASPSYTIFYLSTNSYVFLHRWQQWYAGLPRSLAN
jgi:hypothetical protein